VDGAADDDPSLLSGAAEAYDPEHVFEISRAARDCASEPGPCLELVRVIERVRRLEDGASKQIKLAAGNHTIGCNDLSGIDNLRITGQGSEVTTLAGPFPARDGRRSCPLFDVAGKNITLEGFTLTGIAGDPGEGSGVRVKAASSGVKIVDLRIDGRARQGGPGAMGVQLVGVAHQRVDDVTILRSQLIGFKEKAGVIIKSPSVSVRIYNSVFHDNDRGIGISSLEGARPDLKVAIKNCIFSDNIMGISANLEPTSDAHYLIDYNLFHRGGTERVPAGSDNLFNRSPLFVNAPEDLSLQSTAGGHAGCSPAIDAGDSSHDHSHEPMPAGGRINMGIKGNTAAAALSCRSMWWWWPFS